MDKIEYRKTILKFYKESDEMTAALTAYGEARGECIEGITAVLNVIKNRKNNERRWADNAAAVCLEKFQFSCWRKADPNFEKLIKISFKNRVFQHCFGLAYGVLNGYISDNTGGADHYYDTSINPPYWSKNMTLTKSIGKLVFLKS
ncbi:cell wall hydrolase [candidate division KSB1 bacterium]